jgi:starvation-inducible DNA-binding protein
VEPSDTLAELREDNASLTANLREAHEICEKHPVAEVWVPLAIGW